MESLEGIPSSLRKVSYFLGVPEASLRSSVSHLDEGLSRSTAFMASHTVTDEDFSFIVDVSQVGTLRQYFAYNVLLERQISWTKDL